MKLTSLSTAFLLAAAPALAQGTTVSHGISAFGDLKYPADFAHFDYVNPDAPKGGEISFRGFLASQTFDSLNLFILKGEPAQGLERLHDTLLVRAYDEPDAYYGLIAETLEYPDDRSWVIFTMRPEARFSDGTPITAEDVVWTFETLAKEGAPNYRIAIADVEKVEALGPNQVRFDFREGAATRDLPSEVGAIPILPKHYYETVPFNESTLEPPVSSGGFLVDRVDPGRSIRYCRNPDYWAANHPVNVGADNFECFTYEFYADNTAAFESFKAGEYLLHEEFFSALWATNYDFPALNNGWVIREEVIDGRPSGTQGFWINMRKPKFQDIRVREALGYLFNFEWSNETLFYGLYSRTDSFWEGTSMEAVGVPEGAELALLQEFADQLPPAILTEPAYVPPVSAPQQSDRAAIRAAGVLLDAAGWKVGDDGFRRNAEGELFEIEFLDDSPAFERIVLPFIANMERAGIRGSFELVDPAQMQERQEAFDFDMLAGRFSMLPSPSIEIRTLFGSESADQPGSFNYTGLADPVVDALISRVISAPDRESMEVAVRALDRVLRAKHIWVPNWNKGTHWLAYWDVFGKPDEKPPYIRGEDYWWWDQAKYDDLKAAGAF